MPDRVATPAGVVPQPRASLWQVIRDQRKTIVVGLVLAVAAFWILGQLDEWRLATSLAIGVALGLLNHLATERWLLGLLTSGREPSRAVMMRSTMVRLLVLTVVAVTVAVLLLARRHRGAAGAGRLPPHRPGDDHDPLAEGAEEPMTLRNVRNAALVLAIVFMLVGFVMTATEDHHEKAEITIGEHVTRTVGGLTFNIDTIISTLFAGAAGGAPRLPGPSRADQGHRGPRPHQASADLGGGRGPGQQAGRGQPRQGAPVRRPARDLALLLHPVRQLAGDPADRAQPRRPPAAGADGGHQPHLRAGRCDDRQRLGLRHPTEGR